MLSASYSLTANDEKFDEYVKELNELFDKYEKNGIATVPNYTEVYIGEVSVSYTHLDVYKRQDLICLRQIAVSIKMTSLLKS